MAVRTKRLVATYYTGGLVQVYTCPLGRTALIKSAHLANFDGVARVANMLCWVAGNLRLWIPVTLAANAGVQLNIFHVLHPGDRIYLDGGVAGANVGVHMSGAELDGVAP